MKTPAFLLSCAGLALAGSSALAADPIKIGVIAEAQAVAGSSIGPAAQLAADEINAKGGIDGRKIEIVVYDNHLLGGRIGARLPARRQRRQGQRRHRQLRLRGRAGARALGGRLKTVMITPGAASDVITQNIAKDYDQNKYTFHGYLTSSALAGLVCDAAKDLLVDPLQDEVGGHHQRRRRLDDAARRAATRPACPRSD